MKKIITIIGILSIAGLSLNSCDKEVLIIDETTRNTMTEVTLKSASDYKGYQSSYTLIGEVKSAQQVEIKAETSGIVEEIYLQEGQEVIHGDVILEIQNDSLSTQVKQANGAVISARAQLDKIKKGARAEEVAVLQSQLKAAQQQMIKLKKGARAEEVKITEINIDNTKQSLEDAENVLEQTREKVAQDRITVRNNNLYVIKSASTVADKIMGLYLQDIVVDGNTSADCAYRLLSSNKDSYGRECRDAFNAKDDLHTETSLVGARTSLLAIQDFLEPTLNVVEGAVSERNAQTIKPETLTKHKNSVIAAKAELEAAINQIDNQLQAETVQGLNSAISITNAENRVHDLRNTLSSLEQELKIKKTGATIEEMAIQQSQIDQVVLQLEMATKGGRYEDIRAGEGALTQAYAKLEAAQNARDKSLIKAPFIGTILDIQVEVGDYVNIGSIIASIGNIKNLEVIMYVSEEENALININNKVKIISPHGYTDGYISKIAPSIDPMTRKMQVTIRPYEQTKKLTIGSGVRIQLDQVDELGIMLPLSSVKFTGEQAFILTIDESGHTKAKNIELGNSMGGMIHILEGLESETKVVVDARGVQEGEKVKQDN